MRARERTILVIDHDESASSRIPTLLREHGYQVATIHATDATAEQLHVIYDQTIRALGAALDLRDTETENHCRRVAEYAVYLAQVMGIEDQVTLRNLRWGSYLHDIGKIGIPDAILKKPAPLNNEEREIIRKHPVLGGRMLRDISFLAGAVDVVLYHHERYDGTGYPHGLSGERIPLAARIFSVADAVDAMTSDRPYNRAVKWSAVADELRRNSGSQFDPRVVEAFLSVDVAEWSAISQGCIDYESEVESGNVSAG
jgi:putative nucleotidyltransferase with HDIG domain